jgi:hypothetical protein
LHRGRLKLVESVPNLVASHQSFVTLGFLALNEGARAALQAQGCEARLENKVWSARVPTGQLTRVLAALPQDGSAPASVLSSGSPLESAFLEALGEVKP